MSSKKDQGMPLHSLHYPPDNQLTVVSVSTSMSMPLVRFAAREAS